MRSRGCPTTRSPPPDSGTSHSFTDVTDASQNDAISWMSHNEITTGKSPTTFAPDETLTRAEAATFLHRLEGEPAAPAHSFVDVVKGWQQDSVSWMADTGITTGKSPTTFAPEDTLNRAELVTFLYRYQDEPDVTLNTSTPHCDPSPPSDAFGAGDTILGFPSGSGVLSGNFRNGVQVSASGGMVTITMSNGGTAEYSHATYTCTSPGGCTIVNGRVTKGTVNATTAEPTPDLVVGSPTVDASAPVVGERFTLSATVRNLGNGRSAFTTLRYYQSDNATITTADTEVDTDSVSGLDAQESGAESTSVTAPSSPGTYYYGACVDSVSDESDTTNNCSTAVTVTVGAAPQDQQPPDSQFSAVTAGWYHSCGLRTDNTIQCWGRNHVGQTGSPDGQFSAVTAGWTHSCGLRTDNTIACWGDNDDGQTNAPDGQFRAVTAGTEHSCGLRTDNTITCWGDNFHGEVDAPAGQFRAVTVGSYYSCGLRTNDTITCWGDNDDGQTSAPDGQFSAVTAGAGHSCGLRTDNTIACWGNNHFGQTDAPSGQFSAVTAGGALSCGLRTDNTIQCWGGNTRGQTDAPSRQFRAVTAGVGHSCGLRTDGNIQCWGDNYHRQTVAPASPFRAVTVGVNHSCGLHTVGTIQCWGNDDDGQTDAPDGQFRAVAAGSYHSCGLRTDNTITCWGHNDDGQTSAPDGQFSAVTAGAGHSCGLRTDNTIACWGNNHFGQTDAPDGQYRAITVGKNHSCGLRTDNTIACWGYNLSRQTDAPDGQFRAVTAGWYHSCGLRTDNTIQCWGMNHVGQTGAPDGQFSAVTAGWYHSCGLRTDNTIACWGNNHFGQTGAPDGQFSAVTAGWYHSCGLRTDNTIACWNALGLTDAPDGQFRAITVGSYLSSDHSCGLRTDNTIACWGENHVGQTDAPITITEPPSAPAPNLVVDIPTVDVSALAPGARFTLSAMVRNLGDGRSASTTLRYYQSVDATITTGDTAVGTDSVSGLDAQESGAESTSVTAPSSPGTYYYGACVDSVSDESDTTNNCSTAVTVTVTVDTLAGGFKTVSAGYRHSCGIRSDGTAVCWGSILDDTPAGGFKTVSVGVNHSCGIRSDGTAVCWGDNTAGQADAPAGGFKTVSVGVNHSCGIRSDGTAVCWGYNGSGQADAPAGGFKTVSVGVNHSCGIRSDGTAVCWGDNTAGQADAPAGGFKTVSAGGYHSCGIRSDGTAVCWGYNWDGQAEAPAGGFKTVSAGVNHSCGIRSDGTAVCWGDNWDGQADAPAGGFKTVSAGVNHSCGIRSDGTAVCWGDNEYGQTGAQADVPAAPVVETRAGTSTELEVQFEDFIGVGETRAYDFAVRAIPGGSWVEACNTFSNTSGQAATATITQGFTGLEPGTTYAVRYRYRNSSRCGAGSPGEWSPIAQGTTNDGAAPAPDLVVDTPTVDTSAPVAGDGFTLSAVVRNQGDGRSAFTTLRYYQSVDTMITTGDTGVGTDFVSLLDALESGVESIRVTAPSEPGTYYFGACVDSVSDESDTTNNCSTAVTVTVGAAPAPDLVVDTPTVDVSAPAPRARFTLSATVRNQGNALSASTTLRYYRSTDAAITTGDTEVGTDSVSDFWLHSSGISAEEISLFAPSSLGVYYYGACVDSVSDESNSENNCSPAVTVKVVAVPAPDLIVSTFTVDNSSPLTGTWFILSATMRNEGNAPSASTWLRYYRSTDVTITTGDTQIGGTYSVSRLDAQESEAESLSLAAPSTPGTYYFGACVDSVSDESDATNNCSSAVVVAVGAAPVPDLVVDTPTVDTSAPVAGGRFTLTATVRNQGSGSSASAWLRFGRSTDPTITATQVGTTSSVPELGAQESRTESISLTAPSTPGTYYYKACVDPVSDESDTTNNCSDTVTVTVGAAPAPDLVVDIPTASESAPAVGTSFTMSATVRNQGDAPSASTTLRYYASIDPYVYPELPPTTFLQVPFHTEHVGDLAPSGSSTHSISVRTWGYGTTRYYRACVGSVTDEDKTANNCSAPVAVYVTGTPDLVVDAPTVSDDSPIAAGTPFSLSTTVRNRGNGHVSAATVFYYRSTDSTISSRDQQVASARVGDVGPYLTSPVSATLTAPAAPGIYYYGACVGLVEGETSTTNNCSTPVTVTIVPAPGPDLVVDTPTIGGIEPALGAFFTLYATVRNQGADPSTSATLLFYRSTDSTITTSDERIGGGSSIRGLSPAETVFLSDSSGAPSTSGTYYYGACVVSSRDESNTTNNCSPALTIVLGQPDLAVDTPLVDLGSVDGGRDFGLTIVVRNQGTGSSPTTTLRYYLSTDSTITTGDTELYTDRFRSVGSSDSRRVLSLQQVPSTAGTYYYGVCLASVPEELSTTNNCSAVVQVTVEPADLVILMPTLITFRHRPPDEFELRVSVLNRGNLPSVSTTLRYYRSSDATITSADTPVGTDSVGNLSPHRSSLQGVGLTEPSAAGTYYYGACVDAIGNESTTNNCSEAVMVTVGAVQPPALTLRLTECFVFQNQHFVMFKVTAHVSVSSLVVKTYQVEGRNNTKHLMATINVGNLAAGNSYTKLTSRYFPANLRRNLPNCTADLAWDNGTATPNFGLATTEVPDLPPPDPTDTPVPPADRPPTLSQTYNLFTSLHGTSYREYSDCGVSGRPPCPGTDHIGWWSSLPADLQRCAFQSCDFD